MFRALSDWLAATPLSMTLAGISWVVPSVQTLHILAIGVLMASAVMLDLRLVGLAGRNLSVEASARRFIPWVWGSLAVLAPTGLVLIIIEPERELMNNVFRLKMLLLLAAIALTGWLQLQLRGAPGRLSGARVVAFASLGVWVAIVTCGRWIAYLQ